LLPFPKKFAAVISPVVCISNVIELKDPDKEIVSIVAVKGD
jgi:hypothetical protein